MSPSDAPDQSHLATLLISCADRRGIVAALAQLLYGQGANIIEADQYTDRELGQFFQRIHVDLSELHVDRAGLERAIDEVAARFDLCWELRHRSAPKKVAIFVSRYDHCLLDLLQRHRAGELACDLELIVSNHPDAKAIADREGLEFRHFPITKETKPAQEQAQMALLDERGIDLVVLARYMQILSADFVHHYPARIINIHHSFLPAFIGGRPYHQAYERGVKLIGATAHYATTDLDEGPIIEQGVVRTTHRDAVSDLVRKGRDLERTVLAQAVRWHLDDRILVHGNKTVVFE